FKAFMKLCRKTVHYSKLLTQCALATSGGWFKKACDQTKCLMTMCGCVITLSAPEASAPLPRPWWTEIIVLGMIGSALAVFLLLTVIICYKAIRRYVTLSQTKEFHLNSKEQSGKIVD
uniref:Uncharacterized protein n=1 Tax=Sinocyclocheilus grahami TaxID=75366 RepID=A0A672KU54_SINGR